jgi:hypothetical protein
MAEPSSNRGISKGFSVRLEGTSLFDLVQLECLSAERKVFRVLAGSASGLLFFRGGNLVHAVAGSLVGEPALRAMLAWEGGHAGPCEREWPTVESITASWQSVLLRAAQAQDESVRVDNVVSFPARGSEREEAVQEDDGSALRRASVSSTGDVEAAHGEISLAESVSYAFDLLDRIGEELAIDHPISLEIWTERAHGLSIRDAGGGTGIAWGPKEADATMLRSALEK